MNRVSRLAFLVLFSVILLNPVFAQDKTEPAAPAVPAADGAMLNDAQVKELEPAVEKALQAYNAGDWKAFYADFAKSVSSIATEGAFSAIYGTQYMTTFGKFKAMKFSKDKGSLNSVAPLLVFSAEFEKEKAVQVSVNFIKEEDKFKIMQIQFAKMP